MKRFFLLFAVMLSLPAFAGHVMLKFSFESEARYPGTVRTCQVYVPDQYLGDKPACLCLMLDGVKYDAPALLDSLIASGDIPVMIGVFVNPGVITDAKDNVVRYNRSNEYDMTDDRFVSFLEYELLPKVESLKTADGRTIWISKDGNDRMITGASSGGIASFVAAWHRPDLYTRVFSAVGTFVPFRGGQNLQAIVRKTEPKPLRIFLQDGSNDAWNPLFGSWFEANQMLASALRFSGYDCDFDWSDGAHNGKRAAVIFPKVMKWLWRGWPERIVAGSTQNDLLSPLLISGSEWSKCTMSFPSVSKKLKLPKGASVPTAVYPDGSIAVVTMPNTNCLWQYVVNQDGKLVDGQRFYWLHSFDNSQLLVADMQFDDQGNLYVLTNAGLQVCDQNGRVRGFLNLPYGDEVVNSSRIMIGGGFIRISISCKDSMCAFQRPFNVHPAVKGVSPKSQGQG